MIDELRREQGFPVAPMCRVLDVSKSGYYAWKNRKPSACKQEEKLIKVAIKAAHERGRGTYGPEKIQDELLDVEQMVVGLNRIKCLCWQMKIRCKQAKKYKATTDSNHNLSVAPNLLDQDFAVSGPNKAWVADITYVKTDEGWLYLAGIKDLWNREIIGYAMSHRMTQDLVGRALFRAVAIRRPGEGLIHHSDRGSQYCSGSYQKLMRQFKMNPSMSRKGNCWDNAPMESFFGTLKTELVYHRKYRLGRKPWRISRSTSRCFTTGRDDIPVWAISPRRRSTGRNTSCGKGLRDNNMVSTIADRPQCNQNEILVVYWS